MYMETGIAVLNKFHRKMSFLLGMLQCCKMLSALLPLFQNFWKAEIKVTTPSCLTEKISKQENIQGVTGCYCLFLVRVRKLITTNLKNNYSLLEKRIQKSVRLEPLNVLEEYSYRKMLHGKYPHNLLEILPGYVFFIIIKEHGIQRHCASGPGIICTSKRIWHLSTCC